MRRVPVIDWPGWVMTPKVLKAIEDSAKEFDTAFGTSSEEIYDRISEMRTYWSRVGWPRDTN